MSKAHDNADGLDIKMLYVKPSTITTNFDESLSFVPRVGDKIKGHDGNWYGVMEVGHAQVQAFNESGNPSDPQQYWHEVTIWVTDGPVG